MRLRRDDSCQRCGRALAAGSEAEWDSSARVVTCRVCLDAETSERAPAEMSVPPPLPAHLVAPAQPAEFALPTLESAGCGVDERETIREGETELAPPDLVHLEPIDTGEAGASARKEHERRRAKHEQRLEERWGTGRLGRIAKALSDDPQSTKAWAQGAAGEERVASVLEQRLGVRAVLLHDRKVPRTRGNIDHLAIAASGVWIIDAKRYAGKVERRDVGGLFTTDLRLYVGGRDRSKLVHGLGWQLDAVLSALDGADVPVHRALSFVDAEWPLLFRKPLQLDGVWVSWPSKLADLIAEPGPLDDDLIETTARRLAERLPANR